MKKYNKYRIIVFSIFILFICTSFTSLSMTQTVNQIYKIYANINEGQILYAPMYSKTTFLIDSNGEVNHTWTSSNTPGLAVYMIEDGSLLRTTRETINAAGGAGGGVEKITWDGTVIWDFTYYTSDYLSHHDIELLPNGNILMIAWEYKTRAEAIAAGRDPNLLDGNILMPDYVIEVKPTSPTNGDIVWEWHIWDHMIQDFDPSKNNYGDVEDHPELIDINFGVAQSADWTHINSINYNQEFDHILLSCCAFSEIWIIDHSTTTEEASGHTGGNSGKGGDLLYRWGNPRAYRAGNETDQKFFKQHDAQWIDEECPGGGNILVFNNGPGRPGEDFSSVDEIVPPVNENGGYYLEPGSAYGPEAQTWIYTASPPTSFYAMYISGAQRLPSGNTLICDGPAGRFFEVTPEMETVWEYVNPYPIPILNDVFKIQYLLPEEPQPDEPDLDCEGSFNWIDVTAGITLNDNFQVKNIGGTSSLLNWKIESFPNWGNWSFNPELGENLTPEDGPVVVHVTVVAPNEKNKEFEGYIRVENQENPEDFDVIPVYLKTPRKWTISASYLDFLYSHHNFFPILRIFLQLLNQ